VQGPRAQADRKLYRLAMQAAIRATPGLEVVEGASTTCRRQTGRVAGVRLADGRELSAGAVVLTTGTFLRGLIHIGERPDPRRPRRRGPGPRPRERLYGLGLAHGPAQDRHAARLDGRTIATGTALEVQLATTRPCRSPS
jgi:tRNA uridine 5-carboxymethylaminomethyl modification enzyme